MSFTLIVAGMAAVVTEPPPWVYLRINAAGGPAGARYEASLYGPINAYLGSYFPVSRLFIIKPQPKLRPDFDIDPNDPTRHSIDSYHSPVLSRAEGGKEVPLKEPDFIVAKATADINNDRIIVVIEIKPYGADPDNARSQLEDYLEIVARKYRTDTATPVFHQDLYGLLIVGNRVEIITFNMANQVVLTSPKTFTSAHVKSFMAK
jgi:hypothetical protein